MAYTMLYILFVFFCSTSIGFAATPYYDTFTGVQIDSAKWEGCENGKIINGQLWQDLYASNSWLSASCNIPEENITNYLSALVSISKNSHSDQESSVAVKLSGVFYNDTYDGSKGYNNWEGNIFADVRLQLFEGRLYARAVVVRYNNSTGSSKTPLSGYFSQPIDFDSQYLLSIQLVGSSIIFKCNEEPLVFFIKTPIYPTNKLRRELNAMVYANLGEQGYVGGFFDDVCLAETCLKTNFLPSVYELLLNPKD